MNDRKSNADVAAIRAIIERQFDSIGWTEDRSADWTTFTSDFLTDATLFPAARPVSVWSLESFVQRMRGLAGQSLQTLNERALGADILVFGNVAVAMAGCEIAENQKKASRGVEAMLLVKSETGEWKIAAQAWDMESDDKPLPDRLGLRP